MSWGTVGKIVAAFGGLWMVMIIMAWLSLALLGSAAEQMIDSMVLKDYSTPCNCRCVGEGG